MLRIYAVMLDWIAGLSPVIRSIDRHDPNLASQLRRASTSVCLNTAEGSAASGRAKRHCYRIALREMRESVAALEIAGRLGYVQAMDAVGADRQDRIVRTLIKLAQPGP